MTEPAAVGGELRGTGRRALLVTVDQGLSSVSNLLTVIWVAHVATAAAFGSFSLLLLVFTFVQGPIHALISMRAVVHPEDADDRPREVLGSALVLGSAAGLVVALVGVVQVVLLDADLGPAMVVLGVTLPLLIAQDVGRWVAIARGRPSGAIVLDATWLVLMLATFTVLAVTDKARLFTLTAGWTGSGAAAALVLLAYYGMFRPSEVSLRWLRERWDQSWRLLVGNVVAAGSVLSGAALIAVVSSPVAVAAVRGAILLGRPTTAVQNAVASSMAADVAREKPDNRGLMRHQRRTMAISAVVALANLVVLMLLPDVVGRALLGNVWPVLEPLLLPATLWLVVAAAQAGVPPALIGRHQFQISMLAQIAGGLIAVVTIVVGALLDGASGAVWGLVAGQAGTAIAWWVGYAWHLTSGEGSRRGGRRADARS